MANSISPRAEPVLIMGRDTEDDYRSCSSHHCRFPDICRCCVARVCVGNEMFWLFVFTCDVFPRPWRCWAAPWRRCSVRSWTRKHSPGGAARSACSTAEGDTRTKHTSPSPALVRHPSNKRQTMVKTRISTRCGTKCSHSEGNLFFSRGLY